MSRYTISLERSDAIPLSGYGVLLVFLAGAIFAAVVGDDDLGAATAPLIIVAYARTLWSLRSQAAISTLPSWWCRVDWPRAANRATADE